MDWKDIVGPVLQQTAPMAAKLLLGQIPIVGPILAEFGGKAVDAAVGELLGKQFGVDATPEAVNNAIQTQPTDVVVQNLQAVESDVGKWPAIAEIIKAQEAGQTERLKAAVSDTIDARARDVEIRKVPAGANVRANVMLAGAFFALIVVIAGVLAFRASIPDGIAAILNTICGSLLTMITLAFNFEFGSSRSSSEKSDVMASLLSKK